MGDLLKGKVAVVTGAAREIGEKTARLFAEQGAVVRLWDVLPLVNETAASIIPAGGNAAAQQVDITDAGATVEAARGIVDEFGRSLWDRIFAVNLIGTANCCRAVLPSMIAQKSGRVVNISSVTGPLTAVVGGNAYAASKRGRCLRLPRRWPSRWHRLGSR